MERRPSFLILICTLACIPVLAVYPPEQCPVRELRPAGQSSRKRTNTKGYIVHPDFSTDGDSPAYVDKAMALAEELEEGRLLIANTTGRPLFGMRPLSREEEALLFKAMNYLKYRASWKDRQPQQVAADLELARTLRRALVLANCRLAFRLSRRFRLPHYSPEDTLEEALLSLVISIDGFDVSKGSKFSSYFSTSFRRHIGKRLNSAGMRNRERERNVTAEDDEEALDPADYREKRAEARVEAKEMHARVASALMNLSARQRQVLVLYYGLNGERPHREREIAEQLGITQSRVGQIRHESLGELRQLLGDDATELFADNEN